LKKIRVALKARSYDIVIGSGLINQGGRFIRRLGIGKDAVIVTNRRLLGLYGKKLKTILERSGFTSAFEIVPDSEKAKSSKVAISLLNRIASRDKYKSTFLVALGGGVVGDLTGFVASIYKRGVPYIQIPTTLLAQVDSAIGGKTAIDLPAAKNLAGAFYQPKIVISDVSVLKSLSPRRIKSAMAEVIKYGVIKDKVLFSYLEKNYAKILRGDKRALEYIVARASSIKSDVVAKDELDNKGLRIILNYGHTAGHAIEAASSYSGRYDHGESVAIGMAIAAQISLKLKMISEKDALRITSLIKKCGLALCAKGLDFSKIYKSLGHDKKFIRARNRFVLPVGIGKVRVVEGVPGHIIKDAILKYVTK
jgi:3-dehydroquinate synthase